MDINNLGLKALTTESERREIESVGCSKLTLEYLEGSEKSGASYGIDTRLYNVLSPKVPGYTYTAASGVPTFSRETLVKFFGVAVTDQGIKDAVTVRQGFRSLGR